MSLTQARPGQMFHASGKIESEFLNIWKTLIKLHLGEWRFFAHEDGLYLQRWSAADHKWYSRVLFKPDGDVDAVGNFNNGVALTDVGN